MNTDALSSSSSSSSSAGVSGSAAAGQTHCVQNVAELRALIEKNRQDQAASVPRTYIWIPFSPAECVKVKENSNRLTLNESAKYHAEGTPIRQLGMDMRRAAGQPLSQPYTAEELCAAFNASDMQDALLERVACKSPTVIQKDVACDCPPKAGDTVYVMAHGRRDHNQLFANDSSVHIEPNEVVERMQESKIANDIAKLKLISCGSHGVIHQSLAAAFQDKEAYMNTRLVGYGFSKPAVMAPDGLLEAREARGVIRNSQNFSFVREPQPDVPSLTANMDLGHVVTAINADFFVVQEAALTIRSLEAQVEQAEAALKKLEARLKDYDPNEEAEKLLELEIKLNQVVLRLDQLDEWSGDEWSGDEWSGYELSGDEWSEDEWSGYEWEIAKPEDITLKNAYERLILEQEIFIREAEAVRANQKLPFDLVGDAKGAVSFAKNALQYHQKRQLQMDRLMGRVADTPADQVTVYKSSAQKIRETVRDIVRPELSPAPEVDLSVSPSLSSSSSSSAGDEADQGYSAGPPPLACGAEDSPGTSLREHYKRAGGGGEGGVVQRL